MERSRLNSSECLSFLNFIRNRSINIIEEDDIIYHHLFGSTIDCILNVPYQKKYFGNEDLKIFYLEKFPEYFSRDEISQIHSLLREFMNIHTFSRENVFSLYSAKVQLFLQCDSEFLVILRTFLFLHYAFALMYQKYSNSLKEANFILCMVNVFKRLNPIKLMHIQYWNIKVCCEYFHCKYDCSIMKKMKIIICKRKVDLFNRSSRFIFNR